MPRTIPTFYEDFAYGDILYESEIAYSYFPCPYTGNNILGQEHPEELLAYYDNLDNTIVHVSPKYQKLYNEFKKHDEYDSDFIAYLIEKLPGDKKIYLLQISHPDGVGGDFAELLYEGEYTMIWEPICDDDIDNPEDVIHFSEVYDNQEKLKLSRERVIEMISNKESLIGANLMGMNLEYLDFGGTDLTGTFFRYSNLSHTKFTGANLNNADFSCAELTGANFESATLDWGRFNCADMNNTNLSKASMAGVNLTGANLSNSNLQKVDLSDANLQYANLSSTNLTAAKLNNANLRNTTLVGADLTDVDKTGADFDEAIF